MSRNERPSLPSVSSSLKLILKMLTRTLLPAVLLTSYVSAAAISVPKGGVATLDVVIPANRHDDLYYTVCFFFAGLRYFEIGSHTDIHRST